MVRLLYALMLSVYAVQTVAQDRAETAGVEAQQSPTEAPWDVPIDVLKLQIKHLPADELSKEASRWQSILRRTVRQLNQENIKVWYENKELAEAQASSEEAPDSVKQAAEKKIEEESERKEEVLDDVAKLRERRVKVIDRLNVVLDELSAKLGKTAEGKEQDEVVQHRLYVTAVKGLAIDVADTQSTRKTIISWFKSSERGLRMAKNVGKFIGILAGFWLLGIVLGRLISKAMALSNTASQILRQFVAVSVRRVTWIVGFLLGLAAMEVNITPVVAVIGAAGFVIAFALQNTLSNFASGLMIMLYKPFDIGDLIETSEVFGKVKSMTLVTTNVMSPDNKLLVVPNNELWSKVITNYTDSSERRIDLIFGIGYDDDIATAEHALAEVVKAHPKVLEQPETVIRVAELADSSVNLICRPWVKTEDYWPVHWDLTRAVKERFDAEGISIPFPQQDVHHYHATPPDNGSTK